MNIIRPEVNYVVRGVGRILGKVDSDDSYFNGGRYTPEIGKYIESQLGVVADDIKQVGEEIGKKGELLNSYSVYNISFQEVR